MQSSNSHADLPWCLGEQPALPTSQSPCPGILRPTQEGQVGLTAAFQDAVGSQELPHHSFSLKRSGFQVSGLNSKNYFVLGTTA